jgi:hypothetical protein
MDLQEAFDRGFEQVKSYIDAELAFLKSQLPVPAIPGPPGPPGDKGEPGEPGATGRDVTEMPLPIELNKQIAAVARLLHEAPPIEAVAKKLPPPPRLVKIERDEAGSFVPVYADTAIADREARP